jgi:hypothetical protein
VEQQATIVKVFDNNLTTFFDGLWRWMLGGAGFWYGKQRY